MRSSFLRWCRRILLLLLALAFAYLAWRAAQYFLAGRSGRHRVEAAWMLLGLLALLTVGLRRPREDAPAPSTASTGPPGPAWLVVSLCASVVLYWPALGLGLLSDDFSLLGRGWAETAGASGWEHYRPLPLLTWKVLERLGGPAALHLLNIALHGINAWLVARLAHRVGHDAGLAAGAGALLLAFPAAVEPVAWNSGIFDVGMVCFGLLSLQASLDGRPVWVIVVLQACALLTKETAVVFPAIALLLRCRTALPLRAIAATAALTTAYVLARFSAGTQMPAPDSAVLSYTIKEALVRPFASLAIPWTGRELDLHPWLFGIVPTAGLAALLVAYGLRPAAGFRPVVGPAVVLTGILPLWTFVYVDDQLQASRYLYLPLVGWTLFLADLLAPLARGRLRIAVAALLLCLGGLGAWGVRRHLGPWHDAARLRDAVIRSARATLAGSGCPFAEFTNVPHSVGGAYVLANGFREAAGVPAPPTTPGPACTFAWTGEEFTATASAAAN